MPEVYNNNLGVVAEISGLLRQAGVKRVEFFFDERIKCKKKTCLLHGVILFCYGL